MQVQKLVNATSHVVSTWRICLRRIERFRLLRYLVSDLWKFGALQYAVLHRALHCFLVFFRKYSHLRGLDPEPDMACLGIVNSPCSNRRTDFVFMTGRKEESSFSNVDGNLAISGINGSIARSKNARRNQQQPG